VPYSAHGGPFQTSAFAPSSTRRGGSTESSVQRFSICVELSAVRQ
jgi:hypothetical protein